MTIIDPVNHLLELVPLITKTAEEGAAAVEKNWLCCYPRPLRCNTDQGPEFGQYFQNMLKRYGIKYSTSTSRNPQGNAIIERIHQAVGNVLRIEINTNIPKSIHDGRAIIKKALARAMHACRCASNGTISGLSAGTMAFHRDMHLDIPLIADILTLQDNRQAMIDKRLLQANAKHISHDYAVNDQVLKHNVLSFSDKLKPAFSGPYPITKVHTNGTVWLQMGAVTDTVNIRRIDLYRDTSSSIHGGECSMRRAKSARRVKTDHK